MFKWIRRDNTNTGRLTADAVEAVDDTDALDDDDEFEDESEPEIVEFRENGGVALNISSMAEAKLALKQLRLRKRELGVMKRELTQEQRGIRAEYTDKTRRHGSQMRGGGSFGNFVRAMQTASRDSDRKNLAKNLAPLEQQRAAVEAMIATVDNAILRVEEYIIKHQ